MRIETRQEEALIIGADTTSFGLNLKDPSVFVQMLLKLYESPIDSVCREICSNMIDSHHMSGTDKPGVIGIEDDKFFVQDFGNGMSPEFMSSSTEGYCTIGYSTKRADNQQLGYWGYGRLSPLAYTNQYYVNTVYQGVAYQYLIFLDGNTIKQTCISQQPTEEPSGTRVVVHLKKEWGEFNRWRDSIYQQCAYFENIIISINGITCHSIIEKNGLLLKSNLYSGDTHIVLGCVSYPINWTHLRQWEFLSDLNLAIHVGLDEGLYPTPSREDIVYNQQTEKILISKFESVCEIIWKECDTYLRELNEKKEIHRLRFRANPRIVSQQISYEDYKTICALLNKDVINVEVYPEIESNPNIVWRTIIQGFNGMKFDIKPIYKQSWTTLNKAFCRGGISRSKNKIDFYWSVLPDYTNVDPSEQSIFRNRKHDEIRDELVKQFIEEFTLPFDEEGFEQWKKNNKQKKEKKEGVSYYRESLNSLTNCVKDKGEVNLSQYHYIFTVDSDETAKKFWYPVSKLKKAIILYKDKSGMSTSLDELKPTPFLKRLCSEALRAKVGNILGNKITDKTVLKIIQQTNPLVHQYLVELNLNVGKFTDEHQALVEAGELLGCFDKDEMKLKYVEHHLNKLLFIKYLGKKRYDWEGTQYDAEEIKLIKRYYILERLAEKKEVKEEEVNTNQLTLELC